MTREDALALLDVFRLDCDEPPPPDQARAAQHLVEILSLRHRRSAKEQERSRAGEGEAGAGAKAERRPRP